VNRQLADSFLSLETPYNLSCDQIFKFTFQVTALISSVRYRVNLFIYIFYRENPRRFFSEKLPQ
jgi:hypothetical protein